ncbi:hypothetical protein Cgig2_008934 [Carnegiea gigantea]|uniref:BED-type domain-containing protein n=1 Tax=Carnegiea gigantea TaxID=171969 RepID=A0A9Q1GMU5_9CARY|nr:hypothetical protein Cgig2_008934 [Carnegiea gigantea]
MATVGISDSQSQEVNIEDTQETTKSASVSASTHKRRKNRSEVWDHFEKLEEGTYKLPEDDDYKRGKYKACNSVLICDSRYGTTNLKRHIKACVKLQGQSDLRQMLLNASGNLSLRAAVVLDPRYKIRAVEIAYTKIYGKDEGAERTKQVLDTLRALFEEYKEDNSSNLDTRISQVQQNVDLEVDSLDPYANEDQGDVDALTEEMTYLDLNASTSEGGSNEPLQVLGVGAFKTMVTRLETWSMLAQLDNSCSNSCNGFVID